jgi:hypothetical protein
MIDKLELKIEDEITSRELKNRLLGLRIPTKPAKLSGKGRYELIGSKNQGVYIRIGFEHDNIYEVSLNPARFYSFKECLEFLELIFEPLTLSRMKIKRMDIAFDLNFDFETVKNGVYVGSKKKSVLYQENSMLTGMTIGTSKELFRIYDKYLETKKRKKIPLPRNPTTRVELQLRAKEIPYKNIYDLAEAAFKDDMEGLIQAFSKITLNQINFLPEPTHNSVAMRSFHRVKAFVEANCYQHARKCLNKSGNFYRTYQKHLSISRLVDPMQEIKQSLNKTFASWRQINTPVLRPAITNQFNNQLLKEIKSVRKCK